MTKPKKSLLDRVRQIAADERGGIRHRWEFGRELIAKKAGRKNLPHGLLDDLITAAERAGLPKLTRTDIQRCVRFAEVYDHDLKLQMIMTQFGSWTEIINAGFPAVDIDESDLFPEELDETAPDEWEQLSLLPGFKPTIKVHGRELKIADATVPDLVAYRDKYRAMHEGFAKTLDLIEATVETILDGWDGDPETKAVEAYQRGAR